MNGFSLSRYSFMYSPKLEVSLFFTVKLTPPYDNTTMAGANQGAGPQPAGGSGEADGREGWGRRSGATDGRLSRRLEALRAPVSQRPQGKKESQTGGLRPR